MPHSPSQDDFHVHSTFSDGRDSVMANVARATALGLRRLGCVDHVRSDTTWLPEFVREVKRVDRQSELQVFSGAEAKILDERGRLDLPRRLCGVNYIFAADHRVPIGAEALSPKEVRQRMARGELSSGDVIEALTRATLGVMSRYERVVLAHLFSALPKVGISEAQVPEAYLHILAGTAAEHGCIVEIDERWRCPAPRAVKVFLAHGVEVVLSSDAHRRDHIAVYEYATWALEGAAADDAAPDGRSAFRSLAHARVA